MTSIPRSTEDLDALRVKIKQAVHILSLYDSPFPDARERHIRQTQITYIQELEEELRLATMEGTEP